jgi:hypothetical protein
VLIDFPNYSHANPWQIKTIQTAAPMEVLVVSKLELRDCYALHISWEDFLLRGCEAHDVADDVITKFEEYLKAQALRSRILWTVHNLTSHFLNNKEAEQRLRRIIMEYASVIILMSIKHIFVIPEKYHSKVSIIPHYIEESPYRQIPKNFTPTFFRYGKDRGRKDQKFFNRILCNKEVKKFISDSLVSSEVDDGVNLVVKRRFSIVEAHLYARLSNFTSYYQEPKLNSGVINFCIGNGLAVFHDPDSVRYVDLPHSFEKFCLNLNILNDLNAREIKNHIIVNLDDVNEFIFQRRPSEVSKAFWKCVLR